MLVLPVDSVFLCPCILLGDGLVWTLEATTEETVVVPGVAVEVAVEACDGALPSLGLLRSPLAVCSK